MVNDTSLIETIKSRGHWVINIRPEQFEAERVPFGQLETVANNSVVRRRGWPVPMIDYRDPMLTGHNWIGQDIDAQVVDHYEAWRFYQSGQFRHIRSVSAE